MADGSQESQLLTEVFRHGLTVNRELSTVNCLMEGPGNKHAFGSQECPAPINTFAHPHLWTLDCLDGESGQ